MTYSNPHVIPIGLIETVFGSAHTHALLSGHSSHDPARDLIGQIVRYTQDVPYIEAIIASTLPRDYAGNTLKEVSGMVRGAVNKGYAEPKAEKGTKASAEGIRIVQAAGMEIVVDEHGETFMGLSQKGGVMLYQPLRSTQSKAFIRRSIFRKTGKPIGKDALAEIIDTIEADALDDPTRVKLHLRIGRLDEAIYLDPGWSDGKIIRITAAGWTIETNTPVRFQRSPGFGEMPHPQVGGDLVRLRNVLNLDERNWTLFVAFLVNTLRPDGPYMFLLVEGEQGSGKSLLCSIVKRIVDPSTVEKLRVPKSEHDLMIQAGENHVLVYDNTSSIKWDMSDALCSLSTGAGFSTRKYYTDNESRSFKYCRPVVMNGIGQYADRPDLLERSIQLQLPTMAKEGRKTEREINQEIEEALPEIFGCLLDAAACALRRLNEVEAPRSIRMADAAHWLLAAEPALGMTEGTILRAIEGVQEEMMAHRVVNDPIVLAIVLVAERAWGASFRRMFEGTVAELLGEMIEKAKEEGSAISPSALPTHPAHLSNAIKRLRPALKQIGVDVEFGKRTRKGQMITVKVEADGSKKPHGKVAKASKQKGEPEL